MQDKTHHGITRNTRRTFLKSTGMAVTGASVAASTARAASEALALNGGPKAVTASQEGATRWPQYGEAEEKAVLALVRNPNYGPIEAFEKDWKEYYKVPYVKAHFNGTSALASMFFALNLPPGSEIMVPSYTFFATILPMRLFGLVPVFVDINPRTLNFDVEDAKKRLARHKNVKAVLPVHWIGLPAEMDAICDFAKEKGLIVLEDAAHAHGARLKDKLMGTWGRMSIFSYQASKPLPAIEGGLGMYQDRADYERATTFGNYDLPNTFAEGSAYRKYQGSGLGLKLRMHPMAAALARCQLVGLDKRNTEGAAQVRSLNDRITQLPGLYEQAPRKDMQRIYYSWNALFIDGAKAGMSREVAVKALKAEGVSAGAHSYTLQHKLAVYAEAEWWHHKPEIPELPGSEEVQRTGITLPYFTKQVPDVIDQYAKAFEKVWAHRKEVAKS